ncbi:hypothetical protein GFL51_08950 [Rhizobium leguminosarum bv. viciae]|nr:hypothetical protein [Rhizobium leguminosarum bv. viciae]
MGWSWAERSGVRGVTPLCPAGHLPHKGGDRLGGPTRSNIDCLGRFHLRVDLPPCGGDARQGRGGYHVHIHHDQLSRTGRIPFETEAFSAPVATSSAAAARSFAM